MRVGLLLPGLHRVQRGAEIALESIAAGLVDLGHDVLVVGGGPPQPDRRYEYRQSRFIDRRHFERVPKIPPFRTDETFEELAFTVGLPARFRRHEVDLTISCGYPFLNWFLTRLPSRGPLPAHVFVTENGDVPAEFDRSEYRFFRCDGLVCTNPIYEERNRDRWRTALIPNGIDPAVFSPGPSRRAVFGLPETGPVVLVVSALIETKYVADAIRAVSAVKDAFLVVAGDGPLRNAIDHVAAELLPGRYHRLTLPSSEMPDLYRSADVLLHLSRTESFGNVYIEAMCSGLPIVAHDSPVTRWILGDHPELVEAGDREAVTLAVIRALESGRSRAESLVHEAATRFSWTTVALQYHEFLLAVVEDR